MAGFHSDLYATIEKRLLDWLPYADTGGNVTNLAKDLLNRAQRELWQYRAWENLIKRQDLTLTAKAASLPADFGRVVSVFHDTDGDGMPDFYYFNRSAYADNGYRIADVFVKATGHAWTITFWASPSSTPTLEYQAILEDFAGTGTEYSFFPGDLLMLTAQKIHGAEADMVGAEFGVNKQAWQESIRDYEQANQWVNINSEMNLVDAVGQTVEMETFDLFEGSGDVRNSFDNSYDNR